MFIRAAPLLTLLVSLAASIAHGDKTDARLLNGSQAVQGKFVHLSMDYRQRLRGVKKAALDNVRDRVDMVPRPRHNDITSTTQPRTGAGQINDVGGGHPTTTGQQERGQ